MSLSYHTHEERAAWDLAESLIQQARAMMREAEKAMEAWRTGKEMNRLRCERRGIGKTDAEIRWSASATAKNAITNNTFHVGLATMYYNAAAANYARAHYLHAQQDARF
ncbi:hypothetical protein [Actinoplanes utahensis]|uniref:Uncharacterized protein n=1 Tax=Actinoplanes utahensis TaxID=1869 RepID=A0A0A6UVN2_ACTUT|nr:hypothetical protein [Actinoplanes utahensis]KHD78973.1 hypothetical protein MB27_02525 [Actinoplanes utahensis]GIF28042.1 hypothetical protein Aut01nite_10280 [Actinoplanes utahensis]